MGDGKSRNANCDCDFRPLSERENRANAGRARREKVPLRRKKKRTISHRLYERVVHIAIYIYAHLCYLISNHALDRLQLCEFNSLVWTEEKEREINPRECKYFKAPLEMK